jgi:DNA helicase-2/ATP-dependent DNA helicase PcrA
MTRARLHLSISWAAARNPGGRRTRKPSRFLDGLRPADSSVSPASGKSAGSRKAARCRSCGRPLSTGGERKVGRCGDCPATYDEQLYDRLKAWRLNRAGEDKVPAYVVFTDKTLEAIAEVRPTTSQALLGISGIGTKKVEQYGSDVLELIADPHT